MISICINFFSKDAVKDWFVKSVDASDDVVRNTLFSITPYYVFVLLLSLRCHVSSLCRFFFIIGRRRFVVVVSFSSTDLDDGQTPHTSVTSY